MQRGRRRVLPPRGQAPRSGSSGTPCAKGAVGVVRRIIPLTQYIVRRLLVAIPMLVGAMSIVFLAMRVLPGDPCIAMLGEEATREALRDCVRQLGLDRPLYLQYAEYIYRSLQFDFGRSLHFQYTVGS